MVFKGGAVDFCCVIIDVIILDHYICKIYRLLD